MPSNREHYLVRRNMGMSVGWTVAAVACFAFAAMPWVMFAIKGIRPLTMIAALILMAWSAYPIALGTYLLFSAWRRIELSGAPGRVVRHVSWLLWKAETEYTIDRAYLVRQWHHRKHGSEIREVVFIRTAARKRRLADELTCSDLPGLLRWTADVTRVKVLDVRHRAPLGD